jgi:hypothetical protein
LTIIDAIAGAFSNTERGYRKYINANVDVTICAMPPQSPHPAKQETTNHIASVGSTAAVGTILDTPGWARRVFPKRPDRPRSESNFDNVSHCKHDIRKNGYPKPVRGDEWNRSEDADDRNHCDDKRDYKQPQRWSVEFHDFPLFLAGWPVLIRWIAP